MGEIYNYGKYRKKPVVIDAFQLTEDYFKSLFKMVDNDITAVVKQFDDYQIYFYKNINYVGKKETVWDINNPYYAEIPTLEGKMRADTNDFVIKGISGELYPCKPDIFIKTYEKVD